MNQKETVYNKERATQEMVDPWWSKNLCVSTPYYFN